MAPSKQRNLQPIHSKVTLRITTAVAVILDVLITQKHCLLSYFGLRILKKNQENVGRVCCFSSSGSTNMQVFYKHFEFYGFIK